MKAISTTENLILLDDMVHQLQQLNILVGFVQVAVAEAPGANSNDEIWESLNYICNRQEEVHKQIRKLYEE